MMDDDYYDPMYDGGGEYYCCECGCECSYSANRDGMCVECCEDVGDEEWPAEDTAEDDDLIDGVGFAEPGGRSALRAATRDNPRIHPCPTCGTDNVLTPADVRAGYQCNACADQDERLY